VSASVQTMMRDYAAFRWPALNHKARVAQMARVLGFGHRRARSLYNNELGTAVRAEEIAAIAALRKGEAEDALRASQQNYRILEARIAALEALYASRDAEQGGEPLAALRHQARGQG
jgi:hypothetical protein